MAREGVRLVAFPALVVPVLGVDLAAEVVGVEVVAAPVLEAEPVAALGHVVAAVDLREGAAVQMPLAHPGRAVAAAREDVAEADLVVACIDEVHDVAGRLRVTAGGQHGAVGRADRRGRDHVVQQHALAGQTLQMWRLDLRLAPGRQRAGAHLVHQDEKDVRRLCHFRLPSDARGRLLAFAAFQLRPDAAHLPHLQRTQLCRPATREKRNATAVRA